MKLVVNKFGGSCLGSKGEHVKVIHKIIEEQIHTSVPVVVVSAFKDITDKLIDTGLKISSLERDPNSKEVNVVDEIFSPYYKFAKKEGLNLKKEFDKILIEVKKSLKFVRRSGFKGQIKDDIISAGERFSALLISSYLNKKNIKTFGVNFDENFPIISDDRFGDANVDFQKTREAMSEVVEKIEDKNTIVIPGFIGRTELGLLTTLGRGGSDITAIVFSILFGDDYDIETLLWKDVPITSADPKIVGKENVKFIKNLTWEESEFLSNLGGKIIAPKAMKLASSYYLDIKVPCLFDPDKVTDISGEEYVGEPVKCVTGTGDCVSIKIGNEFNRRKIRDFIDFYGYERLFTSDGLGIPGSYEVYNIILMKKDFEEMNNKLGSIIEEVNDIALVGLVGNMVEVPGILGKVGISLEEAGINILGAHPGIYSPSFILYISPKDYKKAIKVLHDLFIASKNNSE